MPAKGFFPLLVLVSVEVDGSLVIGVEVLVVSATSVVSTASTVVSVLLRAGLLTSGESLNLPLWFCLAPPLLMLLLPSTTTVSGETSPDVGSTAVAVVEVASLVGVAVVG